MCEYYENQRYIPLKGWSTALMPGDPPAYSDIRCKKELRKEQARAGYGWQWKGDWYISPDLGGADYADVGRDVVVEEVWQRGRFYPVAGWGGVMKTDPPEWSDVDGEEERTRESVALKSGWEWSTDWIIDTERG